MKLYGAMASPYVARVLMFARLKGVDLPLGEPPGGSVKSPEYLALNPIGKMPTLEVDGFGIAESAVICDYLEDANPGTPGLPASAVDRARSRLIARVVDLYLAPTAGPLFRQLNPAKRDSAVVEAAGKEIAKAIVYLEHFMGPGPFCVGAEPTLGDCALVPHMVLMKKAIFANFPSIGDPTQSGRLATWWQAMEAQPHCKAIDDEYGRAVEGFLKFMRAR